MRCAAQSDFAGAFYAHRAPRIRPAGALDPALRLQHPPCSIEVMREQTELPVRQ